MTAGQRGVRVVLAAVVALLATSGVLVVGHEDPDVDRQVAPAGPDPSASEPAPASPSSAPVPAAEVPSAPPTAPVAPPATPAVTPAPRPPAATTVAPTRKGECPAYPSFPDASCTGWRHTGVTLSAYEGPRSISEEGTVIEGKRIDGDLTIKAANVTIRRSKVVGMIDVGYGTSSNVLIEDVEIDGGNTTTAALGSANFTCRRCDIHSAAMGVNGYDFTIEDSWIHDLYGTGTVHSEAILGYAGRIVVRHSRLSGNYNADSGNFSPTDGGVSSAVSFYTHGSWGPLDKVTFEQNRLSVGRGARDFAGYCLYGGGALASNTSFRHNVFERHPQNPSACARYGSVVDRPSGPNAIWENNRYEDGRPV